MTTLHEQARAEAEKRYPNVPRSESWSNLRAQNAYVDGFLAGHEAATRTRDITTVAELDALPVGSVVMFEDGAVAKQLHRDRWSFVGYNNPVSKGARMLYKYFPARVLHEPEEGR